jgi:hypothetical protein
MRTPNLKQLAVALLLVVVVITIGTLVAAPSSAGTSAHGNRCGVKGAYGYTGFGNVFDGNILGFPPGIVSTNGTITLDGYGNWVVHEVEVINGQVVNPDATFGGTYTLNSDCTFAAMIPGLLGSAFVGVVVDNGKQIRAMGTLPGEQINYVSTVKIHPASME